jgi:hypothetical protein
VEKITKSKRQNQNDKIKTTKTKLRNHHYKTTNQFQRHKRPAIHFGALLERFPGIGRVIIAKSSSATILDQ